MMPPPKPNKLTLDEFQVCQQARLNLPKWQAGKHSFQVVKGVFTNPLSHTDLNEVLLKVAVLNDLYRTFLRAPFSMAKHIVEIPDFERRVKEGDPSVVMEIAKWTHPANTSEQVYVFATKYCFFSNMEKYFIYDERIARQISLLLSLPDTKKLLDYAYFSGCMNQVLVSIDFSLTHAELDTYLWMRDREGEF